MLFYSVKRHNSFSISFDCCLSLLFTDCADSIRFSFVSSFFGLDFYFFPFLSGKWTKWEGGGNIQYVLLYIFLDRFMFYLYVIPPIPTLLYRFLFGFFWPFCHWLLIDFSLGKITQDKMSVNDILLAPFPISSRFCTYLIPFSIFYTADWFPRCIGYRLRMIICL